MAETTRQIVNKIKAYAKKYNRTYLSVELKINISTDGTETQYYQAYIDGFNKYVSGKTSGELINEFEQLTKPSIEPDKTDPFDLDLPF